MNYQVELFHSLLQEFLTDESALLTLDGEVLALRGKDPLSFGTLATAVSTTAKYIRMQEGDIVLLNDPYSGGTQLNDMTFVTALSEDLIWVTRIPHGQKVTLGKSIEDEGLRIPPTPIFQKGQLNEMILGAMQAHPLCPPNFAAWVKGHCQELTRRLQRFIEAVEVSGLNVTSDLIEEYWRLSKEMASKKISDRPYGETKVDVVLDSGELLRLKLETRDGKVFLDFSGTSAGKTVFMTESAAASVCFHSIATYYGFEKFSNAGTLSLLQIIKPTGCWLMAKYPAPMFKGMTCGKAALQSSLELALSHIHTKTATSVSAHCPVIIELKSANQEASQSGRMLQLFGGESGQMGRAGKDGILAMTSLEQIERDFPVRITRIDKRESSGGLGKYSGGRGSVIHFEILKDLEIHWLTDLTLHRPRLVRTCTHGDASLVTLERNGENKVLPVLGFETFKAGDRVTFASASGGGSGIPEVKPVVD